MSEIEERVLSNCQHKIVGTNCKKCGVYYHESNPVTKTNLFDSLTNCSARKYLRHIRKRQSLPIQNKEILESTWTLLMSICQKFQYTVQTIALGIYIFAKTHQKHEKDEKFWAASSLLVASKGIQLDKRVPYLHRFQKYAEKSFPQEQYETAERTIFEDMNYDIQLTTFMSFIHFYMMNGFLFQKDCLKTLKVKEIEDELLAKCKQMLKNGSFLSYQPQKLALSLIKEARINHRLDPWCSQLEILTQSKAEDVAAIQKSNILKPICALSIKAREKLSSMSQNNNHNTIVSLQNSAQLIDNKPKLIRRKNESAMKHSVKQNSFRPQIQTHQTLLANIRSQAFSVTKYPSMNFSSNTSIVTSQKLIPLIGYQNRRL